MSAIRKYFTLWADQWKDLQVIKNNRKIASSNGNVLVMRLDAIGDFLLFLDSARAYKKIYPGKKVDVLCQPACLEFAKASGCFDECLTKDMLKGYQCELLVQTVYSKTRAIDVAAASIPAVRKISIKPDESGVNLSRRITSSRINRAGDGIYDELVDTGNAQLTELNRNAAFVRMLGEKEFLSSVSRLPRMTDASFPWNGGSYFIVFPGASSIHKMWPPERYAEVIRRIYARSSLTCLVCGAQNEGWIFDSIKKELEGTVPEPVNMMGKTTLSELAELVRGAAFLIGNDTSGIHLAASVGTRCVCIAGDFIFGRFIPYQVEEDPGTPLPDVVHAGVKCSGCAYSRKTLRCLLSVFTKKRFECILRISVEDVMKMLEGEGYL